MTTFEITIIALLAAIVVLLIVLLKTAIGGFHGVWQNQNEQWNQLRDIGQSFDEKFKHLTDKTGRKLSAIIDYTYEAKVSLRELKGIEKKNQELLMPAIELLKEIRNCLTQDINISESLELNAKALELGWHPASELPKEEGEYITIMSNSLGEHGEICFNDFSNGEWRYTGYDWEPREVLLWIRKPKNE